MALIVFCIRIGSWFVRWCAFATKYAQNTLVGAIVLRKGHILAIELYLCKCGFEDESLRLFVIEYVANNVQTKP